MAFAYTFRVIDELNFKRYYMNLFRFSKIFELLSFSPTKSITNRGYTKFSVELTQELL